MPANAKQRRRRHLLFRMLVGMFIMAQYNAFLILLPNNKRRRKHDSIRSVLKQQISADAHNNRAFSTDTVAKGNAKGPRGANSGKQSNSHSGGENKSKRTTKKKSQKKMYWGLDTDEFVLQDSSNDAKRLLRFTVRGNPRPLRRHRTTRGHMYNPSAAAQASFRCILQDMLCCKANLPLFANEEQLVMTIIFRTKRPKRHFVGGKPGPGRMRDSAPPQASPSRTDVDNLAKFVLDSLNGLVYEDDRQVASLHATKILDNDGLCEGSTEVLVQELRESDVCSLVASSLSLLRDDG